MTNTIAIERMSDLIDAIEQGGGGGGGSSTLSGLSDVTITSASNGQLLTYDSTAGKWVNTTPSAGGGLSVAELSLIGATWEETSSGSGEWATYVTFADLNITRANDIINVMVCAPTNENTKNIPRIIYQVTGLDESSSTHLELHVKNTTAPAGAYLKIIYA